MSFKDSFYDRLKHFAALSGAPGYEMQVVRELKEALTPLSDEVNVDHMGNLYAVLNGKSEGPKLMISAHSDEIGCMVKDIDAKGFIRIERNGGVIESLLLGRKVAVNGHLGVIGVKAGHLQSPEDRKRIPTLSELYIDVGAQSREEVASMGIRIGDPVTYISDIERFTNRDLVCGKAIDNRSCCVMIVELFEALQHRDFAGTIVGLIAVQEEVGLRGAQIATARIKPDLALVLDTIPCADTPDSGGSHYPVGIGGGPVFPVLAGGGVRGNVMAPKIKDKLIDTAVELNIPYQLAVLTGGTSDISAIHLVGEGVLAGAVTFARRYSHSPVEVADLNDYEAGYRLLLHLIQQNGQWGQLSFVD
jgi:putative aminopeptidase FrvX